MPGAARIALALGLWLAYMANGREIGAGDTIPALLQPIGVARGDYPEAAGREGFDCLLVCGRGGGALERIFTSGFREFAKHRKQGASSAPTSSACCRPRRRMRCAACVSRPESVPSRHAAFWTVAFRCIG